MPQVTRGLSATNASSKSTGSLPPPISSIAAGRLPPPPQVASSPPPPTVGANASVSHSSAAQRRQRRLSAGVNSAALQAALQPPKVHVPTRHSSQTRTAAGTAPASREAQTLSHALQAIGKQDGATSRSLSLGSTELSGLIRPPQKKKGESPVAPSAAGDVPGGLPPPLQTGVLPPPPHSGGLPPPLQAGVLPPPPQTAAVAVGSLPPPPRASSLPQPGLMAAALPPPPQGGTGRPAPATTGLPPSPAAQTASPVSPTRDQMAGDNGSAEAAESALKLSVDEILAETLAQEREDTERLGEKIASGMDEVTKALESLDSQRAVTQDERAIQVIDALRGAVQQLQSTLTEVTNLDPSIYGQDGCEEQYKNTDIKSFKDLLPCLGTVSEVAASLQKAAKTLVAYDTVGASDWSEEQKAQHAILKKFVDDESSYVTTLIVLAKMYAKPCRTANQIASTDLNVIFAHIDDMLELHKGLLMDIQSCYNNFPKESIGKAFIKAAPKLRIYGAYFSNANAAQETLDRCMRESKDFGKFIQGVDKNNDQLTLTERLRAPLKKLNQYMMFIETYYKQTPPHSVDRRHLEDAADSLEELLDQTAEKENLADNLQKVMEIGDAVEGLDENLVLPDRRFMHEGSLKTFPPDSTKPIGDYVILFNDMLLCVHAKSIKDRKFVFGMKIWMHQVSLKAEPENSDSNSLQIVVQPTPEKKEEYTLMASSKMEREEWTLRFGDVCRDVRRYRKVFGVPLQVLLKREKDSDIPSLVEKSIKFIREYGLKSEGIFRLSGRASQVEKLRDQLDQGKKVFFSADMDIHSVASLFKQWLRELPEPLLTWDLFDKFLACDALPETEKLVEMKALVEQLPQGNLFSFQHMVKLLTEVCANGQFTKLNASTLSVVFAPNVLVDPKGPMFDASAYVSINNVCKEFIEHYDELLGWVEQVRSSATLGDVLQRPNALSKKKKISNKNRASVRLSSAEGVGGASCPNLLLLNTAMKSTLQVLDKKKWAERFVVLRENNILILKTQTDKKARSKLAITAESKIYLSSNQGKPNAFTFERNRKDSLVLAAATQEVAQEWVDAVSAIINKL